MILEYWVERNKSNFYSIKLNELFIDTVELISKYSKIGRLTNMPNIRVKVVKDYLITYEETELMIEILTIWDSRRNPEDFNQLIEKK